MGSTPVLSHGVTIPTIAGMKHHAFDHRHVLVPQCLQSKSRLTSSCSSSVGSGTESPVECEDVLHRSHSSPSSSLDSDIGSDNPDEQETLLRHNPGSGGLFDESNIRRVDLSAAFHDHLSLTKLNRELRQSHSLSSSAFPFHAVAHLDNSSNLSSASFASSGNNDKEQVDFLQDMVVTQLDLIDYQKEQLQKKDRQLLGLKQEREKLMSQLERIEKRCNSLNKKLSLYENNGAKTTDHSIGPKSTTTTSPSVDSEHPVPVSDQLLHPNSSCTVFQNQGPEQQTSDVTVDLKFKDQGVQVNPDMIRRSRANPNSSSSSSKKKKLPQNSVGTQQSAAAITQRGVSIDDSIPVHQQPAKKKQRSSSIPIRIMDDMDSAGESCESMSPVSPAEGITILLPKDFLSTTEEYEVVNMRELDVPRLKKQIDVLTPDCDTGTSGSRTPKLSLSSLENSPFFTENGINRLKKTDEQIEVPSFRILTFSPLAPRDQDDEMLDDETFNRRHAKLEIDERRRKR